MNKQILYFFVCLVLVLPLVTEAGPIIRSGESISVDAEQILKGDFYGLATKITISGASENDVSIAGGTVTINAPVAEDLTVLGGTVQIHSDVGDDVRVVGGEVTLGKLVKGDVVVLGGTLTILSTAEIQGDILFMGGSLIVEGNVTGSIHGTADTVRINSEIGGDVMLGVKSLFSIGDKAKIHGDITYASREDVVRAQEAHIVGEVRKTDVALDTSSGFFGFYTFKLSMLIFTAFLLYFIARRRVQAIVEYSNQSCGTLGLTGLAVFLGVPLVAGVLMISFIGLFAGIILLALYAIMLILSFTLGGVMLGYYLQKKIKRGETVTLTTVGSGVFLFSLMGLVPYVGGIAVFACMIIMLGTLSQELYRELRGIENRE